MTDLLARAVILPRKGVSNVSVLVPSAHAVSLPGRFSILLTQPELTCSEQLPCLPQGKCSSLTLCQEVLKSVQVGEGTALTIYCLGLCSSPSRKLLPASCVCSLPLPGHNHLGLSQKGNNQNCISQALSSPAEPGPFVFLEVTLFISESPQGGPFVA